MTDERTWDEVDTPRVRGMLAATAHVPEPGRTAERRRLRIEMYPGAARRGWRYRSWLATWRREMRIAAAREDQLALPGVEVDG